MGLQLWSIIKYKLENNKQKESGDGVWGVKKKKERERGFKKERDSSPTLIGGQRKTRETVS